MQNKESKLEEQDHPLKNTDNAFVKVGKNGEPVIPATAEEHPRREEEGTKEKVTYDQP